MVALSLSISAMTSPRSTVSPTFFIHRPMVPSSMVSLSRGIVISGISTGSRRLDGSGAEGLPDDVQQMVGIRQSGKLERFRVGQGHFRGCHAPHRRIQIVEGGLLEGGGDLSAHAEAEPVLLDDHGPTGLAHRLRQGVAVERP